MESDKEQFLRIRWYQRLFAQFFDIGRTEFATVQSSLDNEGRTALQELLKVKLRLKSEERDGGLNHSLLKTRDTATFHYDFRKVKEALEFWLKEKGGRKSHF